MTRRAFVARTAGALAVGAALPEFISQAQPAPLPAHQAMGTRVGEVTAASEEHAAGSPGENPKYHRFHRVKGGFLSTSLKSAAGKSTILFEHRDVNGAVVYEWTAERRTKA